jgi:hypothetical protein
MEEVMLLPEAPRCRRCRQLAGKSPHQQWENVGQLMGNITGYGFYIWEKKNYFHEG